MELLYNCDTQNMIFMTECIQDSFDSSYSICTLNDNTDETALYRAYSCMDMRSEHTVTIVLYTQTGRLTIYGLKAAS